MANPAAHTALSLVTAQRKADTEAFLVVVSDMDAADMVRCIAYLSAWVGQLVDRIAVLDGVDSDDVWRGAARRVMGGFL